MDSKKNCYLTFAGMTIVVFLCGGICALISLQLIYYEDINLRARVISWIIFAISAWTFLAGIVGLLNLKVLEQRLGV